VGILPLLLVLGAVPPDARAKLLEAVRDADFPAASAVVDSLLAGPPPAAARVLSAVLPKCRDRIDELLAFHAAARSKAFDVDVDFPFGIDPGREKKRLAEEAKEKVRQSAVLTLSAERIYEKLRDGLARCRGGEAALAGEAVRAGNWLHKCELYEALGRLEARSELLAALHREKDPVVLATVLTGVRSDYATAHLEHPNWQVRLAAVGALREAPVAAERVVGTLDSPDARYRTEACGVLAQLTGTALPADRDVWRDWWKANAEDFRAGRFRPGASRLPEGPGRTTFYGIPVRSTRVAFVIDKSGSMKEAGRFETAKAEMRELLAALPEGALVNAVFFAGKPNAWVKGTRPLDAQARRDLEAWVEDQDFAPYTDLYRALEAALELVGSSESGRLREDGPDTIVVLSDGQATAGRLQDDDLIARVVARRARYLRPVIHSVCLSSDARSLRLLAERTGGEARAK
jgi:hypothetical protein